MISHYYFMITQRPKILKLTLIGINWLILASEMYLMSKHYHNNHRSSARYSAFNQGKLFYLIAVHLTLTPKWPAKLISSMEESNQYWNQIRGVKLVFGGFVQLIYTKIFRIVHQENSWVSVSYKITFTSMHLRIFFL